MLGDKKGFLYMETGCMASSSFVGVYAWYVILNSAWSMTHHGVFELYCTSRLNHCCLLYMKG